MSTVVLNVLSFPFELAVEVMVAMGVGDVSEGTGLDVGETVRVGTLEASVEEDAILTVPGLVKVAVAARATVGVTEGTALGNGVGAKVMLAIPCGTISLNPPARATGKFLFNWGDSIPSQGIATT